MEYDDHHCNVNGWMDAGRKTAGLTAEEAAPVEAAAVALDLLGVECCPVARRALGSAPQLRHLEQRVTTGHQPLEQVVSGFSS